MPSQTTRPSIQNQLAGNICEVFYQNQVHVTKYNFEQMTRNDLQLKICVEFESNSFTIIIASSKI